MKTVAAAASGDVDQNASYMVYLWFSGLAGLIAVIFAAVVAKSKLDALVLRGLETAPDIGVSEENQGL